MRQPCKSRLPCCWFHKCQCRVTHPWTLNPAAAKYYRPIRLAAGFQKGSATPASYQMQSHTAILIAYCIGMKKRPSNIVEFCNSCWKWQKRTFWYKVACKKIFMVGPKGGASHRGPPPKYATDIAQLSMCCWIISPFNDFCCFRRVSHCMSPLTCVQTDFLYIYIWLAESVSFGVRFLSSAEEDGRL